MATGNRQANRLRFDGYEADVAAGELRKNGARVPLELQPFQVLAMLLDRPGEVVTREEIQEAVWPDIHIDIDTALNTNIRKIRRALDDSAIRPRYVETLPKRGYRFIGVVELAEEPPQPETERRTHGPWALVAVALASAALGVWLWLDRPASGPWDGPAEIRRLTNTPGLNDQPSISRDGKFVVFASDRADGNLDLWLKRTAGGGAQRLTTHPGKDSSPSLSPDSSLVVFHSEREGGGVYVMGTLGAEPPQLLARGGRAPQISPDGQRVAFEHGDSVYWIPLSGGAPTKVQADLSRASNPTWSPSGDRLLFYGIRPRSADVEHIADWWLADPGAGTARPTQSYRRIAERFGRLPRPMLWSAHHEAIVVSVGLEHRSSAANRQNTNLWALPFSEGEGRLNGEPIQLTSGGDLRGSASTDSEGVVSYSELKREKDIWRVPIDHSTGIADGEATRLTAAESLDERPVVSADGSRIMFRRYRSGEFDYWVLDPETGRETQFTRTGSAKFGIPSPDFHSIAYFDNSRREFVVFSPEGPLNRKCSDCGGVGGWTPDGQYALTGTLPDQREGMSMANGVQLFDPRNGKSTKVVSHPEKAVSGGWLSPDGRYICFRSGGRTMLAPFQGARPISANDWIELLPQPVVVMAWSPDGRRIYFLDSPSLGLRDGFECIWSLEIDLDSGRAVGAPSPTRHFHSGSEAIDRFFSVSNDHLVFSLSRSSGAIFLRKPVELNTER